MGVSVKACSPERTDVILLQHPPRSLRRSCILAYQLDEVVLYNIGSRMVQHYPLGRRTGVHSDIWYVVVVTSLTTRPRKERPLVSVKAISDGQSHFATSLNVNVPKESFNYPIHVNPPPIEANFCLLEPLSPSFRSPRMIERPLYSILQFPHVHSCTFLSLSHTGGGHSPTM